MICSEKCKLCKYETVGHGDMRWQCKISDYDAPINTKCPYSDKTIKELIK